MSEITPPDTIVIQNDTDSICVSVSTGREIKKGLINEKRLIQENRRLNNLLDLSENALDMSRRQEALFYEVVENKDKEIDLHLIEAKRLKKKIWTTGLTVGGLSLGVGTIVGAILYKTLR